MPFARCILKLQSVATVTASELLMPKLPKKPSYFSRTSVSLFCPANGLHASVRWCKVNSSSMRGRVAYWNKTLLMSPVQILIVLQVQISSARCASRMAADSLHPALDRACTFRLIVVGSGWMPSTLIPTFKLTLIFRTVWVYFLKTMPFTMWNWRMSTAHMSTNAAVMAFFF